jgi:LysR family transcriptional regulator for bpeEF and oprC
MDRLLSMQVFVEVVDCGSFTQAADVMGMSQASISSHVAQLERRLGMQLVERQRRSVKPTEEGLAYYDLCQRVLSEIGDTEALLAQSRHKPRGRLRIDVTVALACRLIVPVLPEFINRYPDITLELHHTSHLFDIKHESFDLLFRVGELPDSDLIARPISPMRLVLAASPAYLSKHGQPERPEDLLQHDCIGYIDPLIRRSVDWSFERDGEKVTVSVGGHLACNEGESQKAAAVAGLGIVLAPAYELRRSVKAGELIIVMPEWTSFTHFFIAYPLNRYLSRRVRTFMDFVIEKYPPGKLLDIEPAELAP